MYKVWHPTQASLWSVAIGGVAGFTLGAIAGKSRLLMERDFIPLPAFPEEKRAVCLLRGKEKNGIYGIIVIAQPNSEARCRFHGKIYNLPPGEHGFQIRTFGDLSRGIKSAGGLYNPHGKTHGSPDSLKRSVGSLGNIITTDDGTEQTETIVHFSDWQVVLSGKESVIGRSITVHEQADDFGHGRTEMSRIDGNVGDILCSGVISVAKETKKDLCFDEGDEYDIFHVATETRKAAKA